MGRIAFFLGVFLLSFSLPACATRFVFPSVLERSTFALTGTVYTEGTNQRIPSASLTLCDDVGARLQESSASDSGEFSFQGLRPAHYILKVQASGFQDAELQIDLSFTSERGLSVSLKPIRNSSLSPSGSSTISAHELVIPEAARNLYASGKIKLYTQTNPLGALHDFQSATTQAPSFYEAFYQSGMAYLSLQNPAEAEKQFRKSLDLSQNKYAEANIALGTILIHRNELREGETLLRLGLASNPHSWPGQFELAELELSRGQLEPALAAAQTAAQLAPRQAVVYRLLAVIHLRQKNYPALITALDSYIELDPNSPAGLRAKELRTQAEKQMANSPDAAVAVK
jgi:tetratricopeptide (TPR) repeat protein